MAVEYTLSDRFSLLSHADPARADRAAGCGSTCASARRDERARPRRLALAARRRSRRVVASVRIEGDRGSARCRTSRSSPASRSIPSRPPRGRAVLRDGRIRGRARRGTTPVAGGVEVVFRPVKAPLLAEVRVEGDRLVKAEAARRRRACARASRSGRPVSSRRRGTSRSRSWRRYLEALVEAVARPVPGRRPRWCSGSMPGHARASRARRVECDDVAAACGALSRSCGRETGEELQEGEGGRGARGDAPAPRPGRLLARRASRLAPTYDPSRARM